MHFYNHLKKIKHRFEVRMNIKTFISSIFCRDRIVCSHDISFLIKP